MRGHLFVYPRKEMSMKLYDRDIREPLFEFLEERFGKLRILEEKVMGGSRADVVMVTETELFGIEIKSDADTYARLESQVRDYDRYFDYNIVVVGSTHALHIREHVPEHWGVITVEEEESGLDFYAMRNPEKNPGAKWERKLELLWRPELAVILEHFGLPKYKDRNKRFVAGKIAEAVSEKIDENELKRIFCNELLERDYTTAAQTISEYKKGEIQKKIESETDPAKRAELMIEQAYRRGNLKKAQKKRAEKKKKRRLRHIAYFRDL